MKTEVKTYIRYALVLVLIFLAYIVAKPYLTAIFTSLVLAYMAYPLYRFLLKYLKNESITAGVLTFALLLIIFIPLALMANVLIGEAADLYQNIQIQDISTSIQNSINIEISETMEGHLTDIAGQAAQFVLTQASTFLLSIPSLILNFFIVIFVFYYSFTEGERISQMARRALPLEERRKKRLEKKFLGTIQSLVYGEIAISLLEGIVATIGFYFFGIQSPVFWGLVVGLVALLPAVGPAIIWFPMAVIFYLQGNIPAAIAMAIFGFFVLSFLLDGLARAKVLGIKGHIHPVIILIGVLGGLAAFGLAGLILGPLILVLFDLVVQFYLEGRHEALR